MREGWARHGTLALFLLLLGFFLSLTRLNFFFEFGAFSQDVPKLSESFDHLGSDQPQRSMAAAFALPEDILLIIASYLMEGNDDCRRTGAGHLSRLECAGRLLSTKSAVTKLSPCEEIARREVFLARIPRCAGLGWNFKRSYALSAPELVPAMPASSSSKRELVVRSIVKAMDKANQSTLLSANPADADSIKFLASATEAALACMALVEADSSSPITCPSSPPAEPAWSEPATAAPAGGAGVVAPSEPATAAGGAGVAAAAAGAGGLSKSYKEAARRLVTNLKDAKNAQLFLRIKEGRLPFSQLVRLTSSELAHPELAQRRQRRRTAAIARVTVAKGSLQHPLLAKAVLQAQAEVVSLMLVRPDLDVELVS